MPVFADEVHWLLNNAPVQVYLSIKLWYTNVRMWHYLLPCLVPARTHDTRLWLLMLKSHKPAWLVLKAYIQIRTCCNKSHTHLNFYSYVIGDLAWFNVIPWNNHLCSGSPATVLDRLVSGIRARETNRGRPPSLQGALQANRNREVESALPISRGEDTFSRLCARISQSMRDFFMLPRTKRIELKLQFTSW